jgi:hypothetical protein
LRGVVLIRIRLTEVEKRRPNRVSASKFANATTPQTVASWPMWLAASSWVKDAASLGS